MQLAILPKLVIKKDRWCVVLNHHFIDNVRINKNISIHSIKSNLVFSSFKKTFVSLNYFYSKCGCNLPSLIIYLINETFVIVTVVSMKYYGLNMQVLCDLNIFFIGCIGPLFISQVLTRFMLRYSQSQMISRYNCFIQTTTAFNIRLTQ